MQVTCAKNEGRMWLHSTAAIQYGNSPLFFFSPMSGKYSQNWLDLVSGEPIAVPACSPVSLTVKSKNGSGFLDLLYCLWNIIWWFVDKYVVAVNGFHRHPRYIQEI